MVLDCGRVPVAVSPLHLATVTDGQASAPGSQPRPDVLGKDLNFDRPIRCVDDVVELCLLGVGFAFVYLGDGGCVFLFPSLITDEAELALFVDDVVGSLCTGRSPFALAPCFIAMHLQ